MRDQASRVVHFLLQNAKRAKDTPKGKLVPVDPAELHGGMGLSAVEVSEAIEKVARARIIQVVDGAVLVPDWNKMQKYLEFLEMKERFGDT
jgi:CRP/FNR family transcriptional regulator, cyclic AMP receptor protein